MSFLAELKTMRRPHRSPPAPMPALGQVAPVGRVTEGLRSPAVVAFLRHCGCPFAEVTVQGLREAAQQHGDLEFLAISHAPSEATARWIESVGGLGRVRLIVDEAFEEYGRWGVGLSGLGHITGLSTLRAVMELKRRGVVNRPPSGTRWQQASTFAVDARRLVVWRHVPRHAGDLPDLGAAIQAAASAPRS